MKPPLIGAWQITGMATIKTDALYSTVPLLLRDTWPDVTVRNRTFYYAADGAYVTLITHRSDPRHRAMWGLDDDGAGHFGWHLYAEFADLHPFTAEDLQPKGNAVLTEDDGNVNTCASCGELITVDETTDVDGDPYCGDCVAECEAYRCHHVGLIDDMHEAAYPATGWYCEDHARECYSCEEWFRNEDLYYLDGHDNHYCSNCTSICDHCENRFPGDETYCSDDCEDAANGCNCEAPAQDFSIRNDGNDPLANDERATVNLPAGEISEEGMEQIRSHMFTEAWHLREAGDMTAYDNLRFVGSRLEELGNQWQTKAGNFTKRLSRFAYKEYQMKIPPPIMSEVGNIATSHCQGIDLDIEVTRDLNLPPGDFCHDDSCWWQSYSESRCTLKSNGGFGLRTFSAGDWPTGRAWVLPLKQVEMYPDSRNNRLMLRPTFDTMDPAAFVIFNGYGDLDGYKPARVMAHLYGWTYRRISFSASPMYINCGGYLVAPEEIAKDYTDGSLSMDLNTHSNLFYEEQAAAALAAKEKEMQDV